MTTETDTGEQRSAGAYSREVSESESLAEAVVHAVAAFSGRPPTASEDAGAEPLDPLYETVDPEAIDALFRRSTGEPSASGRIEFDYCGHAVTVDSAGEVLVTAE